MGGEGWGGRGGELTYMLLLSAKHIAYAFSRKDTSEKNPQVPFSFL